MGRGFLPAAVLLAWGLAEPAYAAESETAASITLVSDRVWRGLSQTTGDPSIIGEAKWNHEDGPFVGVLAANYRSDQTHETGIALTPFFGVNRTFGGVNIDAGYLYRASPGAKDRDFGELTVSAGASIGKLTARAGIFHSWHHYLPGQNSYFYLDTRLPLGEVRGVPLSLSGHLGAFDARGTADDYQDWKLGLSAKLRRISLAANLSDANVDAGRSRLEGARHGGTRFAVSAFILF
ncbi:MAG: TorF family putative porin [Sphingobium sp.]